MIKKLAILSVALFVSTAAYAQPDKKIAKTVKATFSFKQSAAYQAALRHAQAVQTSAPSKLLQNQSLERILPAASVPVRYTRKSPQDRLDELENFIKEHGFFPCMLHPQGTPLYQNTHNLVKRLGPQHPITLRIQELKQQFGKNKKTPQDRLDALENFIKEHGFSPRSNHPQENLLYVNLQNTIRRLGPQHPITLRIQELQAQAHKQPLRTTLGWLYALEDFITANNHYPTLGNTLKENQLYFELDHLINTLGIDDPTYVRIKEIRAQYGPAQGTKE